MGAREDADVPPVVPGTIVVIQLKEPTYRDAATGAVAGRLAAAPARLEVLDRESCLDADGEEHATTICTECIATWALDYYVVLADDQTAGAS